MRVAVVGSGPRALWALERLDAELRAGHGIEALHLFGATELGAGAAYAPEQPDYLRLNVATSVLDAWRGEADRGPSFDSWRTARGLQIDDRFPARALAGQYLIEQGRQVLSSLESSMCGLHVRQRRVDRVQPSGTGGWYLDDDGPYDEVLLAPGHADDWPGALRHHWSRAQPPLHEAALPVDSLLARPEIRPGARVVVRGAALTAIDAVLALTLGRGVSPASPDLEIVMTSRTGRLMLPKSEPEVLRVAEERAGDLAAPRAAIEAGEPVPVHLMALARRLTSDHDVDDAVHDLLTEGAPQDPVRTLRRGIAVATAQESPDAAWALGQAWRLLYPALVRRQRGVGPDGPPLGWPDYPRWSAELERLTFGPPLVNARLLLSALESGRVRVDRWSESVVSTADLVVDAVLPPPGIADLPPESLLSRLHAQGHLARTPGRRGARTDDTAGVLDQDGDRVAGLSLVGRATEDDVIGNDTLVRDLHPQVDAWARAVLDPVGVACAR